MKILKMESIPACDFCKAQNDVVFDVPTIQGSWANLCENCLGVHGGNINIGSKLMKVEPQPPKPALSESDKAQREEEFADNLSTEELEDMMMEGTVATACPEGCEVEPDGKCYHGYSSPLLLLGII